MSAPPSIAEREGGARPGRRLLPAVPHNVRVEIVSGPLSLRALAIAGLVLFAVAFYRGRQLSELDAAAAQSSAPPAVVAAPAPPTPATAAAPATSAQLAQPAVVTVTIRLLKFSPEQIEIKAGDTVEWKNADLTPHTATAANKEFDSGSINANASWRYTFAQPGSFPYICTFHPEMKGAVVVK